MRRLRPFGPAARIAASVAMLAVLLSRLHLSGLLPANHHSAVAVAYQLAVALAAYLAAGALDLDVGWTAILAFMPAVAIVQVLPLTVGGLGLREGAFILFLGPLGVSTSQAIALGLLVYFLNLAVSLLGAPAFVAGVRAQRAAS